MFLTLHHRYRCPMCGYVCTVMRMTDARINRRTIRAGIGKGPDLMFGRGCEECEDRSAFALGMHTALGTHLDPSDQAKVDAYRLRRWGDVA